MTTSGSGAFPSCGGSAGMKTSIDTSVSFQFTSPMMELGRCSSGLQRRASERGEGEQGGHHLVRRRLNQKEKAGGLMDATPRLRLPASSPPTAMLQGA